LLSKPGLELMRDNDKAVSETWCAFFIWHALRSYEHQAGPETTEKRVVLRHGDWEAFAIFRTIGLTAVLSTLDTLQFST